MPITALARDRHTGKRKTCGGNLDPSLQQLLLGRPGRVLNSKAFAPRILPALEDPHMTERHANRPDSHRNCTRSVPALSNPEPRIAWKNQRLEKLRCSQWAWVPIQFRVHLLCAMLPPHRFDLRSEEHTSELQSLR